MSSRNEISDEEFSSFLKTLGVDTYERSFGWMLTDPSSGGFLLWIYNNLDHSNALTPREEYRYKELEKKGLLLSPEDLESTIASSQEKYPGLPLPGDKEALEVVKRDISKQEEWLTMLEKHDKVAQDLVEKNELAKKDLNTELIKLNSAHQQCIEDQTAVAEECLSLADQVESITDEVIGIIADKLEVYGSCHSDKEKSSKFLTFGPLEPYRQTQALFRSHFDLYTSKQFSRHSDSITDDDLRAAIVEAKSLEDRLYDALCTYIETKTELCCEQAKLDLVVNYSHVHPSQIVPLTLEAQSALELLVQEEAILTQQIQSEIKALITSRTKLAVDTTTRAAMAIRDQILCDLTHLSDTCQQALALDRVLYCALRHELRTVEQFAHFAAQLRQHVVCEGEAVASRCDSMNEITSEQETCEQRLQTSDCLTQTLFTMLGAKETNDAGLLVRLYSELQNRVKLLKGDVEDEFKKKENSLLEFKKSLQPLRSYIWDGCTKQPNCWNRTVAALTRSLRQDMDTTEKAIVETGLLLTAVKNGDKKNLRKFWQWFLTDKEKLLAVTKGI